MRDPHPILVLLFGATVISFSPVLVKLATADGLGPTGIAFWRTLGGTLVLFGVAVAGRRDLGLSPRALLFAAMAGVAFFVDLFAWHRSIVYAGAGLATVLGNTQVFAAAVISFFVFRERLSAAFLTAAVVAFLGVALLVGIGSESVSLSGLYVRGVVWGLVTGLCYAAFVVCLKSGQISSPSPDAIVFFAWTSLFSALLLGIAGGAEGTEFAPRSWTGVLWLAALAVLVQALAWVAISSALPRVKTAQAGLMLLSQPLLAMVWGAILFAELLTPLQIVGAIITLVAMYVGLTRREAPAPCPSALD